jgi:hypothetical protein
MHRILRTMVLCVILTAGASAADRSEELPAGGNRDLPMLSLIGLGILSGGVISALRTRPKGPS